MGLQVDTWPSADGARGLDATLAEVAGSVAHDLNNVLTVMAGNLALAERHAAGNVKLIRLLDNMRQATERATVLSAQLASLSSAPGTVMGLPEEQDVLRPQELAVRILVVEDDLQVAEFAMAVLEDMGHVVRHSPDAASALASLREERYDLVFSDIVMPGGMSGIDLAETIAAGYPKLPVLLATGYSSAALAHGALRFPVLAKPYSVQELGRRVRQMLPGRE